MAFPARLLHDGEEVAVVVRAHWTSFAGPAVTLAAVLSLFVALSAADAPELLQVAAAAATVAALGRFVIRYARWAGTHVVLTDRRLVHRHGVLARESVEIPLDRVHAVRYRRSLAGRLLGYGDVIVQSGGEHGEHHTIRRLARPRLVQREVSRRVAQRDRWPT